MDVIIFGGQSNMQGQTECLPEINEQVNGAVEYRFSLKDVIPLCHPVGEDLGADRMLAASFEGGGSLVPAFCKAYVQATGRQVMAIHAARGSTTIAEWQKGTQRFHLAAQKIRAGLQKAKELGGVDRIFYVWLQGESDAIISTTEDEYLESIVRYKNSLKKEFGIEKFGIIKVGYFFSISKWHTNVSTYEEKLACDEAIMRAQERAVETDSDFVMLTRVCGEFSRDEKHINPKASGHYNNATMDIIGDMAGSALAKL
jgi:hypothetical protein